MSYPQASIVASPMGKRAETPIGAYGAAAPHQLARHGAEIRARQTQRSLSCDMPRQAICTGPIWLYRGTDDPHFG